MSSPSKSFMISSASPCLSTTQRDVIRMLNEYDTKVNRTILRLEIAKAAATKAVVRQVRIDAEEAASAHANDVAESVEPDFNGSNMTIDTQDDSLFKGIRSLFAPFEVVQQAAIDGAWTLFGDGELNDSIHLNPSGSCAGIGSDTDLFLHGSSLDDLTWNGEVSPHKCLAEDRPVSTIGSRECRQVSFSFDDVLNGETSLRKVIKSSFDSSQHVCQISLDSSSIVDSLLIADDISSWEDLDDELTSVDASLVQQFEAGNCPNDRKHDIASVATNDSPHTTVACVNVSEHGEKSAYETKPESVAALILKMPAANVHHYASCEQAKNDWKYCQPLDAGSLPVWEEMIRRKPPDRSFQRSTGQQPFSKKLVSDVVNSEVLVLASLSTFAMEMLCHQSHPSAWIGF